MYPQSELRFQKQYRIGPQIKRIPGLRKRSGIILTVRQPCPAVPQRKCGVYPDVLSPSAVMDPIRAEEKSEPFSVSGRDAADGRIVRLAGDLIFEIPENGERREGGIRFTFFQRVKIKNPVEETRAGVVIHQHIDGCVLSHAHAGSDKRSL